MEACRTATSIYALGQLGREAQILARSASSDANDSDLAQKYNLVKNMILIRALDMRRDGEQGLHVRETGVANLRQEHVSRLEFLFDEEGKEQVCVMTTFGQLKVLIKDVKELQGLLDHK